MLSELKRIIRIESLAGLTQNLAAGSTEFVIHVGVESDYRLSCEK